MKSFSLNRVEKQEVIDRTQYYISLANSLLQLDMQSIDIRFDLKGRSSGMFVVRQNTLSIRYNQIIFSKYYENSLLNTVAHEVAHYVVYYLHGIKKVKPHGVEWKKIMLLFDVKPEVTSRYDVSELPLNRQTQHDYNCGCMQHQLSTTRHNKVQKRKAVYKCRKCLMPLRWCENS